ncbi:LysR family transcriptional regulator [Chitinolyticbacter meiyuanensis]|uniref:LysR family transcriptional regulator n=1 Tax=Chitinolyticbacter meiyuanensis TaxID=682798 RepID=UPI0011E5AA82|nr:LysR family transcriptional regulator [Chitinolyticbacter meiyuanensis]
MRELLRIDLNRLVYFMAVVEAGSFTAAAERLGVAKGMVSQQVARLERELAATLFTRTTRRVTLTEAGEQFYAECRPLLAGMEQAIERAGEGQQAPRGLLRLTAPTDYAGSVIAPVVARLAKLYPAMQIELIASNEVMDLVEARIDVAIRLGWLKDSSLRAASLGDFEQWVVAAPGYLAAAPDIGQPADLAQHDWLALTLLSSPLAWTFTHLLGQQETVRMHGPIKVNSPQALQALLLNEAGIGVLPHYLAEQDVMARRLVRLLPEWSLPRGGIYAVYPASRHVPAKVRVLIDALRETLTPQRRG